MPPAKTYRKNSALLTTTWAISEQMLGIVDEVISRHLSGEKLSREEIEAKIETAETVSGNVSDKNIVIVDGVALVPVVGVIGKRMSMVNDLSSGVGVSTQKLQADIESLLNNKAVESIVLLIDSPGGNVDGLMQFGEWMGSIRETREKPIWGWGDGIVASGGYLIAGVCDRIYVSRPTEVGSMAVVMCHYDRSKMDENFGVKRTFITSGKYKRMASDAEPLSQEGKEYLQYFVDSYHAMFVEMVAAGRKMDAETVGKEFADGRVWMAKEALDKGMIDGIATLEETIAAIRAAAMEEDMTPEEYKKKHPEQYQALVSQIDGDKEALIKQAMDGAKQTAMEEVAAETKRIYGVYNAIHGEEKGGSFSKLCSLGTTGEQLAEMKNLAGQETKQAESTTGKVDTKEKILNELQQDNGKNLLDSKGQGTGPKDYLAAIDMVIERDRCTRVEAVKKASKEFPALYNAYTNRTE